MSQPRDKFTTFVGFAFLAVLGYVLYLLGAWVYHKFVPVPSVSLAVSAWFEPPAAGKGSELRVAGIVLENGNPVKQDRIRLFVEDWRKGIRQSLLLDVKDGRFDSGDQPSLRPLTAEDRLRIRAEFEKGGARAAEEVYLGARAPRLTTRGTLLVLGGVALWTLGFFWLFTGSPRPGKNTWAIILSYLIMMMTLALALAVPPLISVMSPETMAVMQETPVGVLVADTGQRDLGVQWVLNIGGVVVPSGPKARAKSPASETSGPPSPQPPAPEAEAEPVPPSPTKPLPPEASPLAISGGLVVPLYVLILSVIGGAINMTRKLPDFQREAAVLAAPGIRQAIASAVSSAVGVVTERYKAIVRKPAEEKDPEEPAPPPAAESAGHEAPAPPVPEAPEERLLRQTAEWRKGLITQHMYLISAPFLGIAVYYLLAWTDLLKPPVLVLVSFSVGLISDKILGKILGIASELIEGGGTRLQPAKP